MAKFLTSVLAPLVFALPSPLSAEPVELPARPGEPVQIAAADLSMPATLGGLPRNRSVDYGGPLNVSHQYDDGAEFVSLYVYLVAAGTTPVWFDMASYSIESRASVYGTVIPAQAATAFAPPGTGTPTGLIATWATDTGQFRSTGLAIFPLREGMLVKLRVSSAARSADELARWMPKLLSEISWPSSLGSAGATRPVSLCSTTFVSDAIARPANLALPELRNYALSQSTAAALSASARALLGGSTAGYCRDRRSGPPNTRVYRRDTGAGLLVVLSDAGKALEAAPVIGRMPSGFSAPMQRVSFFDGAKTYLFPPLRSEPAAAALISYAESSEPVATSESQTVTLMLPPGG